MDAFEAQRRLSDILARLNASSKSVEVALQFLLKNHELVEDLYLQILDTLGKANLGLRVNILFFLDYLCGPAGRRLAQIRKWVARDITQIVEKSIPAAVTALANVSPVDQILHSLARQQVLDKETYERAQQHLQRRIQSIKDHGDIDQPIKLKREDILRRMDEDRERTKKVKEKSWAIDLGSGEEFNDMWNTVGGLTALDREQMSEDNQMARDSRRW